MQQLWMLPIAYFMYTVYYIASHVSSTEHFIVLCCIDDTV